MKALKIIGIILLIIIVLFLIVAAFLPSKVEMEGRISVDAPARTIFKQVNTIENWDHWSPFPEADPNMVVTYEGEKTGTGAIQSWVMQGDSSQLTIIESDPYQRIRTKLDVLEDNEAYGKWTFDEQGDSTIVTWGLEIHDLKYPFGRFLGLFMETMMKPSFATGLQNLKEHAESLPPYPQIEEGFFTEKNAIAIYDTLYFSSISESMGIIYGELMGFIEARNLTTDGMPFTIYYDYNPEEGYTAARAGIPVLEETNGRGRIESIKLGPSNVVKAIHKGAYENLGKTYEAIDEYIAEFNKQVVGAPWEVYVTDPMAEQDTARWVTHVFYPVAE
mgnify:CR=1 FL=1